jgi:hypothetical protein
MKKLFVLSVLALLASCKGEQKSEPAAEAAPAMNALTEQEKADGWQLLFDGTTMNGWRTYQNKTSDHWSVADGMLQCSGGENKSDLQVDVITEGQYGDFELSLEWKVAPGSNSGLMFRVTEEAEASYMTGPEYQLIDSDGWAAAHPDAGLEDDQKVSANYDMHVAPTAAPSAVGEWNQTRLVVKGAHVEHWLNGIKVVDYELWSPDWEERVKNSKWNEHKGYGRAQKGHICLQDHGDPIWFRNIKIKAL